MWPAVTIALAPAKSFAAGAFWAWQAAWACSSDQPGDGEPQHQRETQPGGHSNHDRQPLWVRIGLWMRIEIEIHRSMGVRGGNGLPAIPAYVERYSRRESGRPRMARTVRTNRDL